MGFLKEAGDSLLKAGEKIINKTEEISKIAKLTLDIKKLESDIEKNQKEIGAYITEQLDRDDKNFNGDDVKIANFYNNIKDIRNKIYIRKKEIDSIREQKNGASAS